MRLLVELGLQLLARTAGAGAMRAASLRHEAVDDAMEHDAVIEALPHQLLDPRDMDRREIRAHFNGDGSLRGLKNQSVFGGSHAFFSGCGGGFRVRNSTAKGRPAMAPAMLSVNGIGVQRCNIFMAATRYGRGPSLLPIQS